jgi:hypothetical protein
MIFDALHYFETLAQQNRLCREHAFKPVFCSGPDSIEGLMQQFQKTANFVMIDDTTDQNLYSEGVSYFKRRVYTVFILAAYRWDDMEDREEKLNLCREIFQQFVRRMIWDRIRREDEGDDITFLNVEKIYSKEFGRYTMSGVTGLYFMVENDEPTSMEYEDENDLESEWVTETGTQTEPAGETQEEGD